MAAIPKTQSTHVNVFELVKRTVRIEDYAQNKMGLSLKARANGELWMCCPFHQESTPSFHIRPKHQDFQCFGCGVHGDVVDLEVAATKEANKRVAAERILAEYGQQPAVPTPIQPVKPVAPILPMPTPQFADDDPGLAWLATRGIGASVAARNRGGTGRDRKGRVAVQFPYIRDGEVLNRQTRALDGKGFLFEPDAPVIPFGLDDCVGMDEVVIVEGVMDKLAIEEATGRIAVLAMPNATPGPECYELACDAVADAGRVIVAVDNDAPGQKLRDGLVRRIGSHKCAAVAWPDGCKDANDLLLRDGEAAVATAIAGATDYPVEGVFTIEDSWDAIEQLYSAGMPPGDSTGWSSLNRYYTVRRKQLTVITGTPGSGKSMFADALLMNLAKQSWDWTFAVCSPEQQPLERHWTTFISQWAGKPFGDGPTPRLDRESLRQAREFLSDRFFMVMPEEPSVDAVIEKFLWAHHRHGVGGLLLDPWNELDHTRPHGMTETEYCNRELRKLKRIGWQHDVAIWLVAHPTKLYRNKQDGTYPVPTLYDIAGSAAFANKADNGIVVCRDKSDDTLPVDIHVQKIRFHEIGGLTGENPVKLRHDKLTGRYYEALKW